MKVFRWIVALALVCLPFAFGQANEKSSKLPGKSETKPWYLRPVVRPSVPVGLTETCNPIDFFLSFVGVQSSFVY